MLSCKTIKQHSETSMTCYFGEVIEIGLAVEIGAFAEHLRRLLPDDHLYEIIPSYTSIFIEWNVLKTSAEKLKSSILEHLKTFQPEAKLTSDKVIELAVCYDLTVAPDLSALAEAKGLNLDEIIELHSQQTYTVASMGFAPGFAYLAGLDQKLATPRQAQPKTVSAGSLGIADDQTAIYPAKSPGGWNIIGNCPTPLFDLNKDPMTPFFIGAKVQFKPILLDEFEHLIHQS